MAWIFSLSAECGANREVAEEFAQHFRGLSWTLSDGVRHDAYVSVDGSPSADFWAMVTTNNVSKSGVTSEDDARQMTELGHLLYERLRTATSYRYALVGVEVDTFRDFHELDRSEVVNLGFHGLVLRDDVWERLGSPAVFVPFVPGYRWRPYEGESYHGQGNEAP